MKLKTILLFLIFLSGLFGLTKCVTESYNLSGDWERYGDQSRGSILQFLKKDSLFEGIIKVANGEMAASGFVTNAIKFSELHQISANTYHGFEHVTLQRQGEVIDTRVVKIALKQYANDFLEITCIDSCKNQTNSAYGIKQKWKKIK